MKIKKITKSKVAFIAGISLLVMTVISVATFASLRFSPYSIIGIAVIILLDLVVAWALYLLLKPVNQKISFLMSASRVVYALFFFIALINLSHMPTFLSIWDKSLILFGVHLLLLGYLVYKSKFIPKIIGVLLIVSSFGYLIDNIGKLLGYSTQISLLTFWGEIIFALWLAFRNKKLQ